MSASDLNLAIGTQSEFRFGRWAATAMFFVNGLIVGSWAPHIPGFVARLGISEFTLGLLILGYGLGALVAMMLAGQMIGRMGSRKTLCLFAVPTLFLMPLAAQATDVWIAAAVFALFGGAIGGIDVAMNANVVAVEKQSGRATMSTAHGCWSLGGFIGGGLGGFGIKTLGSFQHAAIVAIIAAVIIAFAYAHITDGVDEPQKNSKNSKSKINWPRQPSLYIIGAMALLCMCAEGAVLNWSALFLQKELLADTATVGLAFASFSGVMALTRFFGDGVRNRFGSVATFRWSCIVAALGMFAAGLSPWPWLAIVAFALSGVGMANLVPILFSAAGKQPGLNSGVSVSVVTTIGHLGILLVPSVIGFVAGQTGLASVYVAIAVLLGTICFMSGKAAAADLESH